MSMSFPRASLPNVGHHVLSVVLRLHRLLDWVCVVNNGVFNFFYEVAINCIILDLCVF